MFNERLLRSIAGAATCVLLVTAARAVTIDYVVVANPGNADEIDSLGDGYGGVDYAYRIGKYEVTNAQYAEMLNAVAVVGDANGLYNTNMGSGWSDTGGIARSGSGTSGDPWLYVARPNRGNRPVTYVNWYDAQRFANWMYNGQPSGGQDATTTEEGVYDVSLGLAVSRNPEAWVFLPTEDEWYKAAYYDASLNDGEGGYWRYPTRSSTAPTSEPPPGTDLSKGSANCKGATYVDTTYYTTEVGAYDAKPSDSAYGTFDQGGNVWEWNETLRVGSVDEDPVLRGGSFRDSAANMASSIRNYTHAENENERIGFRLASVLLGDVNGDWQVNGLDVAPFVDLVVGGQYQAEADCSGDGAVNGLDVGYFVDRVISGGGVAAVPEPCTLALASVGLLGLLSWQRKVR